MNMNITHEQMRQNRKLLDSIISNENKTTEIINAISSLQETIQSLNRQMENINFYHPQYDRLIGELNFYNYKIIKLQNEKQRLDEDRLLIMNEILQNEIQRNKESLKRRYEINDSEKGVKKQRFC
jgi:hypothetical protein